MKGPYGNIGVLISDNSFSPQIVSDISNLGSVSSNWNSHNVNDYDKDSSDRRLILENLKLKNDRRLVIESININSISNKFDNLKLIYWHITLNETKSDSTFPLNQFPIRNPTGLIEIEIQVMLYICSRSIQCR